MHPDVPGATWECPGAGCHPARIEEGQSCALWCSEHQYGGMITCAHDNTWDETFLTGCH